MTGKHGIEIVAGDRIDARLMDLVERERDLHPIYLAGVEQAAGVVIEPEDRRPVVFRDVAADTLEETGAVVQRVREDVNLRVREVDELAVHPDLLHFIERHEASSSDVPRPMERGHPARVCFRERDARAPWIGV